MSTFGEIPSNEPTENYFLPPGVIMPYGGTSDTAPSGWLFCNGFSHSRTTYANLYATVGTTYGAGNGSTTFNVPDLRRKMVLGFGTTTTGTAIGVSGGDWDHTHSGPAHTHDLSNHTHAINHNHGIEQHSHTIPNHSHSVPATNFQSTTPALGLRNGSPDSETTSFFLTGGTVARALRADAPFDHYHRFNAPASTTSEVSLSAGLGGPTATQQHNGSSGAPSNNISGTAGTAQTGSANPPYLTLQYIIKI
jgi:microcystin-dependent protein